jgi:hypothetical protein
VIESDTKLNQSITKMDKYHILGWLVTEITLRTARQRDYFCADDAEGAGAACLGVDGVRSYIAK